MKKQDNSQGGQSVTFSSGFYLEIILRNYEIPGIPSLSGMVSNYILCRPEKPLGKNSDP